MDKKSFGDMGEAIAAKHLQIAGYTILERKYKVRAAGEIDIIAALGEEIIFVEVKSRSSCVFGMPAEAVNRRKQCKIIKTAQWYLLKTTQHHKRCRFDIIEVLKEGDGFRVNQIKNAFE